MQRTPDEDRATPGCEHRVTSTPHGHSGGCYARIDHGRFQIGNTMFSRSFLLMPDGLHPASITWNGEELLDDQQAAPGPSAGACDGEPHLKTTFHDSGRRLDAILTHGSVQWHATVFSDLAAIVMRAEADPVPVASAGTAGADSASGIEYEGAGGDRRSEHGLDQCENLRFRRKHAWLLSWELSDRTDLHDNLCTMRRARLYGRERMALRGNLFAVSWPLHGAGVALMKLAPLPHARPAAEDADLVAHHDRIRLIGHGRGQGRHGYPWAMIAWEGGDDGRIRALHALQMRLRPYREERDGAFLTNTWGDRNRDGRIREPFIAAEIAAAAALGADAVQIDDGWQRGITSNSIHAARGGVWQGFWAADPRFWDPHPERFPSGLAPVVAAARRAGIGIGLWFAPDSAHGFANWKRDAELVLRYHRGSGICHFKIDGVKATTKEAERNLRNFIHTVLEESGHAVSFDLDVTAETRPGYFGMIGAGPIFVENRYTDWCNYHPHATLRNLWQLSHVIPPVRLRMEFLNRRRNDAAYGDDPLRPSQWRADTLFAMTMLGSPLGWFEASNLHPEDAADIATAVRTWKQHRKELHTGMVKPIGSEPDGVCWSGFHVACDGSEHLLVFRGLGRDSSWRPPVDDTRGPWTTLGGRGGIEGGIVTIDRGLDHWWGRRTIASAVPVREGGA